MSPIFSIGTIVIAFLLFYICYVIHYRQKKRIVTESFIDDDSYIESIQHLSGKVGIWVWQQYDILLAAQPYVWETMVDLAAYLETADINPIDSLTVYDMPNDETLVRKYVETLIRRTFGTPDAMKLAKRQR